MKYIHEWIFVHDTKYQMMHLMLSFWRFKYDHHFPAIVRKSNIFFTILKNGFSNRFIYLSVFLNPQYNIQKHYIGHRIKYTTILNLFSYLSLSNWCWYQEILFRHFLPLIHIHSIILPFFWLSALYNIEKKFTESIAF